MIQAVFISIFCLFVPTSNECSSQAIEGSEGSIKQISGTHKNLKFLSMFTPGTNQDMSVGLTQDVMASLIDLELINPAKTKSLVICEDSLHQTNVSFLLTGSQAIAYKKQKVMCADDNGQMRTFDCYYGNFEIQTVDLRYKK